MDLNDVNSPSDPNLDTDAISILETILRLSDDATVCTDVGGNIRVMNPAAEHLFGCNCCESGEMSLPSLVNPCNGVNMQDCFRLAAARGALRIDATCMSKGAMQVPVYLSLAAVRNKIDGSVLGFAAILRDRRNARCLPPGVEERTSVELLKMAAVAVQFGTFSYDFESGHFTGSPEFYTLHGVRPDSWQDLDDDLCPKGLHPDDKQHFVDCRKASDDPCGSGIFDHEFRIILPDGQIRWLHLVGRTMFSGNKASDRPLRANGIVQDITRNRLLEQALRARDEKRRTVFNLLPVGVSIMDADRSIVEFNPALGRILDLSPEGLGSAMFKNRQYLRVDGELMGPDQFPSIRAVREQRSISAVEIGVLKEDGLTVWTEVSAAPLPDGGCVAVTTDITERKRIERELRNAHDEMELKVAQRTHELNKMNQDLLLEISERKKIEEAFRQSEERFRTVADFTYDWEYWIAPDQSIVYMSPSCERITGYTRDEFSDSPELLRRIVHPDDLCEFLRLIDSSTQKHVTGVEFRVICKDGSIRWISHASQPVLSNGSYLGLRGSNRDITELVEMEKSLSEIADKERERLRRDLHDGVCQQLAVISLLSRRLRNNISKTAVEEATLAEELCVLARSVAGMASNIGTGLMPLASQSARLSVALDDMAARVSRASGVNCKVTVSGNADASGHEVANQLFLIAQEAVTNAVRHSQCEEIEVSASRYAGMLRLTVRDDGTGFDMTRVNSRGMGREIMASRAKAIGATLQVTSRTGGGTVVVCDFPLPGSGVVGSEPEASYVPPAWL